MIKKQYMILVIFGTFLAFTILELLLNILNVVPLLDESLVKYDPYLGYKFKPNIDKTNHRNADGELHRVTTTSLGFDDIDFRDDGINGTPYAVAIGDSFTAGTHLELEDNWSELLENMLHKDVANLGVFGYGATNELYILENYGLKLKPKVVIWGFFINDFSDDYNRYKDTNKSETFPEILYKRFATVRFIWKIFGDARREAQVLKYKDDKLNLVLWPDQWLSVYPTSPSFSGVKIGENIAKSNILIAKTITENVNTTFILVLFPSKEQVYNHLVERLSKNVSKYDDIGYPTESLRKLCKDNNIKCLDLLPIMTEHSIKSEQIYFPIDGHLNKEGNKIVANAIYNFIIENNLDK